MEGKRLGSWLGDGDGLPVGAADGVLEGIPLGLDEGSRLGSKDGEELGIKDTDGAKEANAVGDVDGASVLSTSKQVC